jgi:hypothetical protein
MDVNEYILSNLDKLDEVHAAKRADYFAKGLPFYTCVDSPKNHLTKELPGGRVFLVKRDFDFEKDIPVDTFIGEFRQTVS